MFQALIPLLKQASTVNASLPMGTNRAAVINVSSIMGSIADNNQGGFYPYRSSKVGDVSYTYFEVSYTQVYEVVYFK